MECKKPDTPFSHVRISLKIAMYLVCLEIYLTDVSSITEAADTYVYDDQNSQNVC